MIVGSLRGIVMITPLYEPLLSRGVSPPQSESTKRTPEVGPPKEDSRSADFAAFIATDPL